MPSPISANRHEHFWRTLMLQLGTAVSIVAIGIAFVLTGWNFIRESNTSVLRSSLKISQSLLQHAPAETREESGSGSDLAIIAEVMPKTDAMIIEASAETADNWQIKASSDVQRVKTRYIVPRRIDLSNPTSVEIEESGGLLSGFIPIGSPKGIPQVLVIESRQELLRPIIQSMILPLLLLLLMSIAAVRMIGNLARRGQKEMSKQIDANRLALLELATHQLGAPIATFRWWLELISDPDNKDLLGNGQVTEQIGEAVNRMDGIIKSLSEANNVESGGLASRVEVLASLKHILQRVAEDATPKLKSHNQTMEISIGKGIKPVLLDTKLIFGILKELVDNAIAFSPDDTKMKIEAVDKDDCVQISVSDHGYGIPDSDLPHIFEKFMRASNSAQHKPVGNGLGLFIAKGIIDNLGGEMWIESKLNRGTTVYLTLPYAQGVNEEIAPANYVHK